MTIAIVITKDEPKNTKDFFCFFFILCFWRVTFSFIWRVFVIICICVNLNKEKLHRTKSINISFVCLKQILTSQVTGFVFGAVEVEVIRCSDIPCVSCCVVVLSQLQPFLKSNNKLQPSNTNDYVGKLCGKPKKMDVLAARRGTKKETAAMSTQ